MTRFDEIAKPNRPQCLPKHGTKRERSVEDMLREIAYVLHLTRKVKAEILEEQEERLASLPRRAERSVYPDLSVAG